MQDENFIAANNNNEKDALHILTLFIERVWKARKTYKVVLDVVMRVLVREKEKLMTEECTDRVIKDDLIVVR